MGPAIWRARGGFGRARRWLCAALGALLVLLAARWGPSTPVIYAPGAGSHWDAGETLVSPSLVGHRQAGDGGDMALLLGEGGLWVPCTGSGWPRCNRMSRRRSIWTCQLLSVLTSLWVPPCPLRPGGPLPVPLHCVCLEQGGREVTLCWQNLSDKQGPFHAALPPWQTPHFINFNVKNLACISASLAPVLRAVGPLPPLVPRCHPTTRDGLQLQTRRQLGALPWCPHAAAGQPSFPGHSA